MGNGARALWAVLRPEDYGNAPFRDEESFLAAAAGIPGALRAIFPRAPMRADRRDWAGRYR